MGRHDRGPRKWLKCNFPMFLDWVVLAYLYFTLVFVGEAAIVRQFEWAKEHADTMPTSRSRRYGGFFSSKKDAKPPLGVNVFAAAFFEMSFVRIGSLLEPFPDIVIALALSFMTLRALHLAALNDPGAVPPGYEAPAWVTTPLTALKRDREREAGDAAATADGGPASPVATEAVAVKCTTPRLSLPGSAGPTGIPQRDARNRHSGVTVGSVAAMRDVPQSMRYRPFEPHFCTECQHERPLRTHHCRYCNQCVVRFDHHCDWIDNCVGQRNHKCFFLFIMYIGCCIIHFLCMVWRWFTSKSVATTPSFFIVMHLICLASYLFIVIPCGLLACFFLGNTLYQLFRDETTIEANFPAKYKTRGLGGTTVMARLRAVLGSSVWTWLWPNLQPIPIHMYEKDAVPSAVVPHNQLPQGAGVTHAV